MNPFDIEKIKVEIETKLKVAIYRELAATLAIRAEELETLSKGQSTVKK